MTESPRQRKLVIDTYDAIINNKVDNPLQALHSTIQSLKEEEANIAEISLLYCLKSDYLFDNGSYDDAYKWAMDAFKMDSERKEVLHSLINIHIPRTDKINKYEDDEKAKEYSIKLENLYPNDANILYVVSQYYSTLGLYDDALRLLKQCFFKITCLLKHNMNNNNNNDSKEFVEEIKKTITQTYIDRYRNCPNNSHETIIKYLIELIQWKYNKFDASNLTICIEEIWERIEYILSKHLDSTNNKNENEWNKIWKFLCFVPCSIPLSIKLLNMIFDIFCHHEKYLNGIEFFSRLITEYQTYNDNMLTIYARFEKYHILYLNRSKLYQIIGKTIEMMEDIEQINIHILMKSDDMDQVTENNLFNYMINENDEKPMIETVQQIKKRRASRLSNIMISPMPKQYRDLHLTPKSNGNNHSGKQKKNYRKRYSSNNQSEEICFDENKDSEELSNKNKNYLLENKLNQEISKNVQYNDEINKLKQKIVKLTDNLNLHIVSNYMDTTNGDKDGENSDEYKYENDDKYIRLKADINQRDVIISELKLENQTYFKMIQSLKREVGILKDCKIKNSMSMSNKSKTATIGRRCMKWIKLLIAFIVFIGLIVLFYDWIISMDDNECDTVNDM